jgi:hypothetical protein
MNEALYYAQKISNFLAFERARDNWFAAAGIKNPIARRDPSDMSIGTGNFTQGIPAFWFARATDPSSLETLFTPYQSSTYVRSAIKYVFRPIASVDLVFSKPTNDPALRRYRGSGRSLYTRHGQLARQAENEIELPQFRMFLREPMRGLTYEDFVEASIGWYLMQECFWLLGDRVKKPFPEVDKNPYEPIIVPRPDQMRPVKQGPDIIAWQYVDAGGKAWTLEPDQVVRLFGWNPYDPHRGLGDYASAAVAAESHWLGGKFKRQLTADNDTAPILSPKNGTPTDDQMQQIKMQLAERRAAKMRGISKTLFLPGEIDFTDPQVKSVDAAFIAGMLEDRHEIFQAFGVPPSLADVKASYSIGQASDWFALIFNTCIPVGNKFCAVLEKLIKALTGQEIEVGLDWDEHYVMQQVRSERMKDADSLFAKGMPVNAISEHLRLNLPRFENDDIGYLPINLAPTQSREENAASMPAPEDYSETPGDNDNGASSDDNTDGDTIQAMMRALDGPVIVRDSKRETLWKSHIRLRAKSVKLFQSKASKVFNDYRVIALKKLATVLKTAPAQRGTVMTKSLVEVIFDPVMFGNDLAGSLEPVMKATLQTAGEELLAEIGSDNPWTLPPQDALDYLAGRSGVIKGVGNTAQSQLNTSLQEGIQKGETTEQLTDRVRGVFNRLTKAEARRIAMTETSAAYGYARHEALITAGITHKAWLSSHGPHARLGHVAAEKQYTAQPILLEAPFMVLSPEGALEKLLYPGDGSLGASASNLVNCHCIQLAAQKQSEDEKSVTYLVFGFGVIKFLKEAACA